MIRFLKICKHIADTTNQTLINDSFEMCGTQGINHINHINHSDFKQLTIANLLFIR